jgi:hypothetical protein
MVHTVSPSFGAIKIDGLSRTSFPSETLIPLQRQLLKPTVQQAIQAIPDDDQVTLRFVRTEALRDQMPAEQYQELGPDSVAVFVESKSRQGPLEFRKVTYAYCQAQIAPSSVVDWAIQTAIDHSLRPRLNQLTAFYSRWRALPEEYKPRLDINPDAPGGDIQLPPIPKDFFDKA